jgi:hypothetical protein
MRLVSFLLLATFTTASAAEPYVVPREQKNHWAWKQVEAVAPPNVKNVAWVASPIDQFVLAKLEAAGLQPAAAATREQLIRRVTFDLIGLPPTPTEIDAFVNDASPNAWAKVIDRLLASPHYGERWGRHWLDLARFAESNGYEYDEVRPDAWRYRDYVVKAINDDMPYDRFIREQLAGDELDPENVDALIATGFNLLGPDMTDSSDQIQRRQNTLNDMTDTAGLAFLGMTIACARCHDHKFEPIPQTDYYRLQAFFATVKFRKDINVVPKEKRQEQTAALAKFNTELRPIQDEFANLEEPHRAKLRNAKLAKLPDEVREAHETPEDKRTPAQRERAQETLRQVNINPADVVKEMTAEEKAKHKDLQEQIKKLESRRPKVPVALGIEDASGKAVQTYLLEQGEPSNKGEEVQPGFPVVLVANNTAAPAKIAPPRPSTTGQRAALAHWIADGKNPMTARVMVNRIWHHHFGRGIVRTTSDFGVRGDPPTHPELLDWLAHEFVNNGWSIKKIHKLMLMSATYQQSTSASPVAVKRDPENQLFSRMNRLRLEGEIIRDNLLSVADRLNPKLGGPSVFPPIPTEAIKGTKDWQVTSDKTQHTRRSLYIFARRNLRFPFLEAFDLPDSNLSCPKRERSTTALQALSMLNASDVIDAANALGERLKQEPKTDPERIELAYRLTLGRKPTADESKVAIEFLADSPLSELCRALFNVNEFIYLD